MTGLRTFTLLSFLALALAHAQERTDVPDFRLLLVAAIDAPDGRAQGVLRGPVADAIAQRFKAPTPIQVAISTVRRYRQPNCSRLNAHIWQDGVQLPGAPAPRRQTIDIGINYCRDGSSPKSLD